MSVRRRLAAGTARLAGRLRGEAGHYGWQEAGRVHVPLEQPPSITNRPRWGHGRPAHPVVAAILDGHRDAFLERLELIGEFGEGLARIDREHRGDGSPYWANPMTSGLDGASIYCFVRSRRPRTYLEIGSGHSTAFAARAIADGGLSTRIVSIDPEPRAEIDALCDEVVRERLETVDLAVFDGLGPQDVVFFDGSHRVFMDNDVSTFFLDVLPRLGPDVLVGVHDVYLPEDYFPEHAAMYWSEQYVLAAALLAGGVEPVLPCHHVAITPELAEPLNRRWQDAGLGGISAYGNAFWMHWRGARTP